MGAGWRPEQCEWCPMDHVSLDYEKNSHFYHKFLNLHLMRLALDDVFYMSYNSFYLDIYLLRNEGVDFPGSPVVESPPAKARDTGLIPEPGRSHVPQGN